MGKIAWKELKKISDGIASVVMEKKDVKEKNNFRFTTGSDLLDMVIGGKKGVFGALAGTFINLCGEKATGKSFVCSTMIAANVAKYGKKFKWNYDDIENGCTFDSQKMYGIEILHASTLYSSTVEEAFYNIAKFCDTIKKDECGIYVLDSLDSLTSDEQNERAEDRIKAYDAGKEYDSGSYQMGKAKYLSREFFPQLCSLIENKNVLVIIVSQVRDNIGGMTKYTRAGGVAIDHYASVVVWFALKHKDTPKGEVTGVIVEAKTTKLRASRPFRSCFLQIDFNYGMDNIGSNIDYLFGLRTEQGQLNAQAKSIAWEGEGEKITVPTVKKFLQDNELIDAFTDSKYCEKGKVTVDTALDFIESDKKYKTLWDSKFGNSMDRKALIQYIEKNNLEETLTKRCIEKWEAKEDSLIIDRKPRFSGMPPVSNEV